MEPLRDKDRRYRRCTLKDVKKLQKLQNAGMRLQLGIRDIRTPTNTLLDKTGRLSIHQLMAHTILQQAQKMIVTNQPRRLWGLLGVRETREGRLRYSMQRTKLNLTDESFLHKSILLLNLIPKEIQLEHDLSIFKRVSYTWVKLIIRRKPY